MFDLAFLAPLIDLSHVLRFTCRVQVFSAWVWVLRPVESQGLGICYLIARRWLGCGYMAKLPMTSPLIPLRRPRDETLLSLSLLDRLLTKI